jgi:ABC-type bacteriocin/lantibiotic exporter with double-glycine peptidase domain
MDKILPVTHHRQEADGYCLPACAQMVLDYLGFPRSQETLAHQLGLRPPLGVPAPNIKNLNSSDLAVIYESGTLDIVQKWLGEKKPVIVFVQAGELPYWFGHRFQHAVLVVGLDEQQVYLLDPAVEDEATAVSRGDFMLAWDEMDNALAIITRRRQK